MLTFVFLIQMSGRISREFSVHTVPTLAWKTPKDMEYCRTQHRHQKRQVTAVPHWSSLLLHVVMCLAAVLLLTARVASKG